MRNIEEKSATVLDFSAGPIQMKVNKDEDVLLLHVASMSSVMKPAGIRPLQSVLNVMGHNPLSVAGLPDFRVQAKFRDTTLAPSSTLELMSPR